MINKVTNKQKTIETYDRAAEALAKKFAGIGPRTKDIDAAFELLGKLNPFVLEIGCGDGRDAAEIVERTDSYIGMDISEGMLNVARLRLPNTKFVRADIETYIFPPGLDIFFAFASLLHVPKDGLSTVLKNAHQAMNPGAIMFISLKQRETYQAEVKKDEFGERLFYYYTPSDLHELTSELFETVSQTSKDYVGSTWLDVMLKKK